MFHINLADTHYEPYATRYSFTGDTGVLRGVTGEALAGQRCRLKTACRLQNANKFLRYGRVSVSRLGVSWSSFCSSNQGMIYTRGR